MLHQCSSGLWLLAFTLLVGACGGSGEAAGLKYRVSDKELRGLPGDGVARVEAQKAQVTKLQDAIALGDVQTEEMKKQIATTGDRKEAAGDAIETAADKIDATQGAQEDALNAARARRDQKIEEAKERYVQETEQIKQRYAAEQAKNKKLLADAKTTQTLTALQHGILKAELAETKARQNLHKQEVRVARAQLEVVKYEEVLKMTGAQGPSETQRKINIEQQALNEQKKLVELQAALAKAEAATQTEKAKLDAERAKLAPAP